MRLLELIFQGFVEWIYGLVLECWEYFSSVLLDIMSMDFTYLKQRMPIIETVMEVLLAVGWALLIGNLVFQAIKTMLSGIGFEGEDPKLLFTRTFVFSFLLLASPQICNVCLNLTSLVIELLQVPDAVDITFADEASFGGLAASWLLVIVCGVIVMFQSFKLIFEMAERYLILAVLSVSAPLAFAMGGSRSTSDIFSGWCRMYGSMCLLMAMHVVFIKMLLSILSFYPSGLDVLPWMILVLATVKVAKKIDSIITRIGLNPAITGDPLGRLFPGTLTYMVVRGAASQVSKTIGRSTGGGGGAGKGHAPNTPPGGAGGGPHGGIGGAGGSHFAGAWSSQRGSQQGAVYQNSAQQNTAQQGTTVQGGSTQTTTQERSTGPAFSAGTQFNQPGTAGTRRTSVPPGGRHTIAHTQTGAGAAVIPGTPGRRQSAATAAGSGTAAAVPGASGREQSTTSGGQSTLGTETVREQSVTHPGMAGISADSHTAETRSSQMNRQTVRNVVNSTAQAREQGHVSVSRDPGGAHMSGGAGTRDAPGAAASPRRTAAAPSVSRFTRRETSVTHGAQTRSSAPVQQEARTGQAAPPQPGTAGMAGAAKQMSPSRPTRPGREAPPSPSAPSPSAGQRGPARQERAAAPRTPPAGSGGTGPVIKPGTAGTPRNSARAPLGREPARQNGAWEKSTPAANEAPTGHRMPSPASQGQKPLTSKATMQTSRPDRGERNGRKR